MQALSYVGIMMSWGKLSLVYKVFIAACGAIETANSILNAPGLLMLPYIQSTEQLIY